MKNLIILTRANPLSHGGLLLLMLAGLPAAQAADTDYQTGSWYLGAGVGKSRANIDQAQIAADLQQAGFSVNNVSRERRDESYKLYGGYQLLPYLALEGGYYDLGNFSFAADTLPVSLYRGETRIQGLNLALVGTLPLTSQLSALAKLGVVFHDSETRFDSNGLINVDELNDDNQYLKHQFGVGLQYQFDAALALRLEAERYRIDDLVGHSGDIDVVTLSMVYRYGAEQPYHEPTPAPQPMMDRAPDAPMAARPATEEQVPMTSGLIELDDVHFEFDQSRLTPATQAIVRQHLQTLKANPQAKVRIAGYTSKSGSESYNQRLSEQRAEAIKAFLVQEGLASPDRLTTIGFGEHQTAEYEADPTQLRSPAAKANMRVLFEITVE